LARRYFLFGEYCVVIGKYHTKSLGVPKFFDEHLYILNGLGNGISLPDHQWKNHEANLQPSLYYSPYPLFNKSRNFVSPTILQVLVKRLPYSGYE